MKIPKPVAEALSAGKFSGRNFFLPPGLERKAYLDSNSVLETLGGKWSKSAKAHVFSDGTQGELEDAMEEILASGECVTIAETVKRFQYYPTPASVAKYLVSLVEIKPGASKVLEPSAGRGAIAKEIAALSPLSLTMVELDSANLPALRREFPRSEILEKDFMAFSGRKFDAIVMNPPFSKSQDAKHILHAYSLLSPGGKLVSAASSAVRNREGTVYAKLRSLSPKFLELPAGSFRESGTMVNTVVVVLEKP